MLKLTTALALFGICLCMKITHKRHLSYRDTSGPTDEPDVSHAITFHYFHSSHDMYARVKHQCYILHLNSKQITSVHTTHGLYTIERTMISKIDHADPSALTEVSFDDLKARSPTIAPFCAPPRVTSIKILT